MCIELHTLSCTPTSSSELHKPRRADSCNPIFHTSAQRHLASLHYRSCLIHTISIRQITLLKRPDKDIPLRARNTGARPTTKTLIHLSRAPAMDLQRVTRIINQHPGTAGMGTKLSRRRMGLRLKEVSSTDSSRLNQYTISNRRLQIISKRSHILFCMDRDVDESSIALPILTTADTLHKNHTISSRSRVRTISSPVPPTRTIRTRTRRHRKAMELLQVERRKAIEVLPERWRVELPDTLQAIRRADMACWGL